MSKSNLPIWMICLALLVSFFGVGQLAEAGETITYYHVDPTGSPVAATNEAGTIIWRESYRPYGEQQRVQDQGTNNRRFAGKSFDDDTDLSYFGARYYDPVLGRFMAIDAEGFDEGNIQSFNRYAYANNNPQRFVDPDGNIPLDTAWDIANVVYDVGKIGVGWAIGNEKLVIEGGKDLVADVVATAIPYVPAGSTKVGRSAVEQGAALLNSPAAKSSTKGVNDLVAAAAGKTRGSGDVVVSGGRDRAKELFREFDVKGVGNRTVVRDKTGGGRGVEGALEDGTPLRIRMKPDGTTRMQAGQQKFIFPPK